MVRRRIQHRMVSFDFIQLTTAVVLQRCIYCGIGGPSSSCSLRIFAVPLFCTANPSSETSCMVMVANLSDSPHKADIWFTPDELESFKSNMMGYIRIVRLLIAKHRAPSASNILGLEKFLTVQLTEEYQIRRVVLIRKVVDSSAGQHSSKSSRRRSAAPSPGDADRLARISAENSKWARERAYVAALFLELDQEDERLRDRKGASSRSNGASLPT